MKNIIYTIIISLITFIIGYNIGKPSKLEQANYNTLPYKVELIMAYENYQCDVENLLDSLESHYNFMDVEGGSDTYYYYHSSRVKVDSLLNLEN